MIPENLNNDILYGYNLLDKTILSDNGGDNNFKYLGTYSMCKPPDISDNGLQ